MAARGEVLSACLATIYFDKMTPTIITNTNNAILNTHSIKHLEYCNKKHAIGGATKYNGETTELRQSAWRLPVDVAACDNDGERFTATLIAV